MRRSTPQPRSRKTPIGGNMIAKLKVEGELSKLLRFEENEQKHTLSCRCHYQSEPCCMKRGESTCVRSRAESLYID